MIWVVLTMVVVFSPALGYGQFGDQFSSAEPDVEAEAKYTDGYILFSFDLDKDHHITDLKNGFFKINIAKNEYLEILGAVFPKAVPYDKEMVFKGQFDVKVYVKTLKPVTEPVKLKFEVHFQVCQEHPEEVCFPPASTDVELSVDKVFNEVKLPDNAINQAEEPEEDEDLPALKDLSSETPKSDPVLSRDNWPVIGAIALVLIFIAVFFGVMKPQEDPEIGEKFGKAILVLVLIAGAFLFIKAINFSQETTGVHLDWVKDLEKGKELAKKENRPMMVDTSAEWCVACKELEHETLMDPEVAQWLQKENYVLVKLDFTTEPPEKKALRKKLKVKGMPTVIFYDKEGKETKRFAGFKDKDSFFGFLGVKELSWFDRQVALLKEELKKKSLLVFGLIFLLGFLTSLTPCVYPVIPIVMGYIGTRSGAKKSKGFYLSIFFVLGLAIVYSILGVVAGMSGSMIGASFQDPIVVIVISSIFIVMGLSMAGLFEIPVPSSISSKMQGGGGKSEVIGAMLIGGVAAVVAAPCVGPVLIALLTWISETRDAFLGFLLTFIFSLGMGVLFLIVGTFSGAISSMPKGGKWMDYIKYFFAALLVGGGIFVVTSITTPWLSHLLWGIFLLSLSIFIGLLKAREEDEYTPKTKIFQFVTIIIFLVGIHMFLQSIDLLLLK